MEKVDVTSVMGINVPLIVVLCAKQMRVEEIMNFSPGAIIEFSKQSDQLLEILINDEYLAKGEVVKVGETFGIQIKEILDTEGKIRALGSDMG